MRHAGSILRAGGALLLVGTLALLVVARRALAPPGGSPGEIDFDVAPGASLQAVAGGLADAGVVRSRLAFEWLARWRGQDGALRAGEYRFSRELGAAKVLEQIVSGKVRTHEVVIPEGLTAAEIATRFETVGLASRDAYLKAVSDPALAADLGVEGTSLEGYLFPETYQLARGLPVEKVVRTQVEQFFAVWRELDTRARERGLSMREAVILASIVEKETAVPAERPLVAAVFHNRLQRGMRLETDPTVIYGIPAFDGNLTRAHLDDESNPYNTYRRTGLPPGPIANPGAAALRAAVDPAAGNYLFFVSRNDGSHVFSNSYPEHVAAVNRYQRRAGRR